MRLAAFITSNVEAILVQWEAFARTIWPRGVAAEPAELRDSAAEILAAVVGDMKTAQSLWEQSEKAAGRGGSSVESDRLDQASQVHGAARVGSGLALSAVVAEYRALRASVLGLWRKSRPEPDAEDLNDITRFNEAIDQSLALAVASFNQRINTARNMFLGILGHDLRNPLNAIVLTATEAMLDGNPSALPGQLQQIIDSANAIAMLTKDLIDFTSSTMGVELPLTPTGADLHLLCQEVVRETLAAYPGQAIRLQVNGDLRGTWDAHRLRQIISNLLGNALQHGAPGRPVDLTADGSAPDVVLLSVHNEGDPIPAPLLPTIFDPLVRGPGQRPRKAGSIGLGLYIVREVTVAHGGSAFVTSSETTGTTVTVRLPRHAVK